MSITKELRCSMCWVKRCLISLLVVFISASNASSQSQPQATSGTGFFISRKGEIVTNAHVVQACSASDQIYFTGPNLSYPRQATISAIDHEVDLALLRTSYRPQRIARLRRGHVPVMAQEQVFIIGYPEPDSIHTDYTTATAMIEAVSSPFGESKWLQFTDSVRPGNSGGPLLDFSGNVVGVVTGKIKDIRLNRLAAREYVAHESDVAVTVEALRHFLDVHYVHFYQDDAVLLLQPQQLEKRARDYVVHIYCVF
ncbi:MAG: trypsin-like peptidase domain-containing protein [Sphaerospermopsis sp. SIO1G2]|nr:trypsin-like peptidase domain-containing protein [Sphaerospermopsis sp. SIO1G2]